MRRYAFRKKRAEMAACDFCGDGNVKETAGNGYIMYDCSDCGYVDIWELSPYEYEEPAEIENE